ncbi:hypothetical protein Amsp01_089550 [Amycolatopsis sp. NBRC 101858]|nr:hypothetical protein Amsp01_089550 [Amycolatopsis sp. NBRC 101858]
MGEEDALAEQVGLGATEHLPLQHLVPVDVPFDDSAGPGQGESCGRRVLIPAQSLDERPQGRKVVDLDGGHPVLETLAMR